jgi:Protein of unknown function (DUF1091)
MIRVLIILNILALTFCAKDKEKLVEGVKFRGVECKADNITAIVISCYTRPISKKYATLNVKIDNLRIEKHVLFQIIINFRFENGYRQVMNSNKMNFCALMEGAVDNILFKTAISQMGEYAQTVFHKCPYNRTFEIINFLPTSPDEASKLPFPTGYYRYDIFWFVNDKEALSIKISLQIKQKSKKV